MIMSGCSTPICYMSELRSGRIFAVRRARTVRLGGNSDQDTGRQVRAMAERALSRRPGVLTLPSMVLRTGMQAAAPLSLSQTQYDWRIAANSVSFFLMIELCKPGSLRSRSQPNLRREGEPLRQNRTCRGILSPARSYDNARVETQRVRTRAWRQPDFARPNSADRDAYDRVSLVRCCAHSRTAMARTASALYSRASG